MTKSSKSTALEGDLFGYRGLGLRDSFVELEMSSQSPYTHPIRTHISRNPRPVPSLGVGFVRAKGFGFEI